MGQIDLQLTGGNRNKNRRELDFYATPSNVTIALMEFFKFKLKSSIIWEPACGIGNIQKVLESYGHTVIGTDILTGVDYLKVPKKEIDAIITNPPFNLSEKFIEKSLKEADFVAYLLKSQYWHSKKRYNLFIKNPPSYILPLTWRPDFLNGERGGNPTMEILWTVWIKGNKESKYIPLLKSN